jgi:8-hydroxy-5-deazaflavin:NADPH oxidoreductase
MFVAGPDGPEKKRVLRIVADVGFEAVDAGDLKAARLLEPLAMLWIQLALAKGLGRDFAFLLGRRQGGKNPVANPNVMAVHPQEAE